MVKVPKGYRSRNVEDRRGRRSSGGGGFGFPSGRSGGGLGGSLGGGGVGGSLGGAPRGGRRGCLGSSGLIVLVVFGLLLFSCLGGGGGFGDLSGDLNTGGAAPVPTEQVDVPQAESDSFDLINFVLDDVQEFWADEFARAGESYPLGRVVIFEDQVSTGGCGSASSNVGPFYCPADSTSYIDIQFMFRLQQQLGAEGDFAQAYILAHEIGHHVQNVVGTNTAVRNAQRGASQAESNGLQVRMELQADCLAGMWARSAEAKGILEDGDLQEGVRAAGAVGDDAITGSTNQENFTHGSSQQRIDWFTRGYSSGTYDSCDTFSGDI